MCVTDYQTSAARIKVSRAKFQALITVKDQVNTATEEISMQEFSTKIDIQKTVDATNNFETSLQTSMELPDVINARTQTELNLG